MKFKWNFKQQLLYNLFLLILCCFFIIICASLYDGEFNLRDVCISNLGNPELNSRGWWIFSICMCLMAILIIPHILYLYRNINFYSRILEQIWLFLLIMGSIGMFFVGIVNEINYPTHLAFAAIAFGGYGLALILALVIMLVRVIKGEKWPNLVSYIIMAIFMSVLLGIIIREIVVYGIRNPSDLNFTEWIAFFLIIGWIFSMTIIVKR
ncbi:MAG: DUF998 domain-containing protein [Candidatus Lokiarchaeota archaeon]|nr:DUF998 domain-containing protein [Candidatus Lokiarchaeota archaeon]